MCKRKGGGGVKGFLNNVKKTAEWYFGASLSWIAAATVYIREGVKKVGKIYENVLNRNPNVNFGQKRRVVKAKNKEIFLNFYQFIFDVFPYTSARKF